MSLSATQAAAMLQRKEVSSRELTEALLARIDSLNPSLNAVVELSREGALRAATAADNTESIAPLHGVPMTVKEAFNVAGLHTTWGNPAFKDVIADDTATVVRRLQDAGAIVVGKTNVAFMLGDFGQTANELYGVTNNPWDTRRAPGGSSGGSAAALAAGLTFLDYGSDMVGSIRIPASFCGVYGLKPSVGIVPLAGFQPPGVAFEPDEMAYMLTVGPLARSAADLRVALQVTAGPDAPANRAFGWRLPPPRHTRLEDFRVRVVLDHPRVPVSSEIATVLARAVDELQRAGATLSEGWPEGIEPERQYASFGHHLDLFFAYHQPGEAPGRVAELIEHEHARMAARAAWQRAFEDIDVFVCPTNFTPAFPHDDRPFHERMIATPEGDRPYADQAFWVAHASLPGLPAVTAPIGRTQAGLPVGLQIVGPLYEDDTPITFAELLANVVGGFEPPPDPVSRGLVQS